MSAYLFATVYSVASKHRCTTRGYPDTCQSIGVDLIVLYQPLTLLMLQ